MRRRRSAPCSRASASPARRPPAGGAPPDGRRAPRGSGTAGRRPAAAAAAAPAGPQTAGCSPRWCAGWSPRPGSTSRHPGHRRRWSDPSRGRGSAIAAGTVEPAHRGACPGAAPAAARRSAPRAAAPAAPARRGLRRRPRHAAAAAAGRSGPRDQVVQLSRMRLAVAAGMKASQTLAASVWTSVEVDFDNVERVRQKLKDRFKAETGASLSYLPFVSRATVRRVARASRRSTRRSTSRPRR